MRGRDSDSDARKNLIFLHFDLAGRLYVHRAGNDRVTKDSHQLGATDFKKPLCVMHTTPCVQQAYIAYNKVQFLATSCYPVIVVSWHRWQQKSICR
jgi:hypothetical protein